MSLTHGMNVDEVDALGRMLQTRADQLRQAVSEIESRLQATVWEGQDAGTFRHQWWPEHKTSLTACADRLHGFGQSALNNASEQLEASGVSTGGGAATTGGGGTSDVGFAMSPPTSGGTTSDFDERSRLGDATGMLRPSSGWKDAQQRYEGVDLGTWSADATGERASPYQCTAWANLRWRELGYNGPPIRGDGGVMAHNAPGEVSGTPSLGAMASARQGNHVMIVEEIGTTADGAARIRVSEFNTDSEWQVGHPQEFKDDRWLVQKGDSWVYEAGGRSRGPIVFAAHPKG